jgi:NADPH:quinone reductase-like Zn-dependent oxidoreductase
MTRMPRLPASMRALELRAYEGTAAVHLVEKPLPQPGAGEVLVKLTAAPINPSDLLFLSGSYGIRKTLPAVPGFEGSGTVVAAGPGLLPRMLLGQRVACGNQSDSDGTWAEYMCVSANTCVVLLPQVSNLQAATLIINPLTAWALVERARQGGHRAAIQSAAASSLGQMVLRLGLHVNYPIIHVVRRDEQARLLRDMGAAHVLNSSAAGFDTQLRTLSRELGATCALDAVGGTLTQRMLAVMPRGSTAVVYGLLSGEPPRASATALIFENKRIEGFWLTEWIMAKSMPDQLRVGFMAQRMLKHELKTPVRAALPLDEHATAFRLYEQEPSAGKVLLLPGLRRGTPAQG